MAQAKDQDWVKVQYTGKLDSGDVVDTSREAAEPIQFQVGGGQLIEGFEKAVIGMAPGEVKTFRLEPEEAYGHRDEEARLTFNKANIPEEFHNVERGQILTLVNDQGDQMPGQVIQVEPETLTVDLNHPLAGHPINFEIELVEVLEEPVA
jgi:FKBP-type peptidyl-prolyl cis-trans isomerase 2